MILRDALKEVVTSQKEEIAASETGVPREKLSSLATNLPHALIISGIRRCGKSTLLRQFMQTIENFHYMNFEDTRLVEFDVSDFEKLDEIFMEVNGPVDTYFLDGIQNVKDWEFFVRSRLNKNKRFIITGSNASLLSRELGTRLTGRHLTLELFPFSFAETLAFASRKADAASLEEYLLHGGFPEYVRFKVPAILRELHMDILQRDIVARHELRDSHVLFEIALYLISNVSREFSYNKLKNIFGLGSINTAISYVSFLEDSYLLFTISKFSYSVKTRIVAPKKAYCIDNGFAIANSISFSKDKGRLLENSVFIHLRRTFPGIFYYREKNECDFIIKDGNSIIKAFQVTYDLTDDNMNREISGLVEAMNKFNLSEGAIITYNQRDNFNIDGKSIEVFPAWEFFSASFSY